MSLLSDIKPKSLLEFGALLPLRDDPRNPAESRKDWGELFGYPRNSGATLDGCPDLPGQNIWAWPGWLPSAYNIRSAKPQDLPQGIKIPKDQRAVRLGRHFNTGGTKDENGKCWGIPSIRVIVFGCDRSADAARALNHSSDRDLDELWDSLSATGWPVVGVWSRWCEQKPEVDGRAHYAPHMQ